MAFFNLFCFLSLLSLSISYASAAVPRPLDGKLPSLLVVLEHYFSNLKIQCLILYFELQSGFEVTILHTLFRTTPKWQLWRSSQAFQPQENSDHREILTSQMGNQWLGGVHLRWTPARWLLLCRSSWGPCSQAWQWGFHFPELDS